MKRVVFSALACLLAGLAFAQAGAAPPAPPPVLMVYPLAMADAVPADMGKAFADRVAAEVTAAGGVTVVRGDVAAKPADFRAAAKAAGAIVYFTGSIAPVGSRYAAIEQLVSTSAGVVVWSQTTQFATIAELTGEGTKIRDALMSSIAPRPQQPDQPSP